MTLALYGKSRRRQLILLVAAVVSAALATLGGATLRSAGQAQTANGPDLVATKTNNVGGTVAPDGSFVWTISLSNVGNEDALVPQNNEFFIDYLPTGVSYEIVGVSGGAETPSFAATEATFRLPRGTDTLRIASFECELLDLGQPSVRISCLTGVTGGVYLPAGTTLSLELEVSSLPSAPSTLTNPRSGQLCRIDPTDVVDEIDETAGSNDCSDTVAVAESTTSTTGSITIQKMVPDGNGGWEESDQDIWNFTVNGQSVNNGGTVSDLALDLDHSWTELVPTGYRFVGSLNAGDVDNGAQCPPSPDASIINETIAAGQLVQRNQYIDSEVPNALVCVYNQPTREITVRKMVPNPDVAGTWMEDTQDIWGFKVGPNAASYGDPANQSVDSGDTNTFVDGTTLYAFEQVPAGWQRVGIRLLLSADGTCNPAGPSTEYPGGEGSIGIVQYVNNEDGTVCFYNEEVATEPTTNGLTVKKMVWDGTAYREYDSNLDPDFELRYSLGIDANATVSIPHGVTTQVPFGAYTVWETLPDGWRFSGAYNEPNPGDLVCPGQPQIQLAGGNGPISDLGGPLLTIDEETSYLVCIYNQELNNLTVKKMVWDGDTWVPDNGDWGFKYQLMSETINYDNATSFATNAVTTLPVASYRVFENVPAGSTLVGFSNYVSNDATCGTEGPGSILSVEGPQPHSVANIDLTSGDKTVCFYNEPDSTGEPDLLPVTVTKNGNGN